MSCGNSQNQCFKLYARNPAVQRAFGGADQAEQVLKGVFNMARGKEFYPADEAKERTRTIFEQMKMMGFKSSAGLSPTQMKEQQAQGGRFLPTHSPTGMPNPRAQQGWAAVQDTIDAATKGQTTPRVAQAVATRLGIKVEASGLTHVRGSLYRCQCGRFASLQQAHLCPLTTSPETLGRALARRAGVSAGAYDRARLQALLDTAQENNGQVIMRHAITGQSVTVPLEAMVGALTQGYRPSDWKDMPLVDNGKGQLIPVENTTGIEHRVVDPTVLARQAQEDMRPYTYVAALYGVKFDANMSIVAAGVTHTPPRQTYGVAQNYNAGHFYGTDVMNRKDAPKVGTSVGEWRDEPVYRRHRDDTPLSDVADASTARQGGANWPMKNPQGVRVGRVIPAAVLTVLQGKITTSENGVVQVYNQQGDLVSQYDPATQLASDTTPATNATGDAVAAILAHGILQATEESETNADPLAVMMAKDFGDVANNGASVYRAIDAAEAYLYGSIFANGNVSIGGKLEPASSLTATSVDAPATLDDDEQRAFETITTSPDTLTAVNAYHQGRPEREWTGQLNVVASAVYPVRHDGTPVSPAAPSARDIQFFIRPALEGHLATLAPLQRMAFARQLIPNADVLGLKATDARAMSDQLMRLTDGTQGTHRWNTLLPLLRDSLPAESGDKRRIGTITDALEIPSAPSQSTYVSEPMERANALLRAGGGAKCIQCRNSIVSAEGETCDLCKRAARLAEQLSVPVTGMQMAKGDVVTVTPSPLTARIAPITAPAPAPPATPPQNTTDALQKEQQRLNALATGLMGAMRELHGASKALGNMAERLSSTSTPPPATETGIDAPQFNRLVGALERLAEGVAQQQHTLTTIQAGMASPPMGSGSVATPVIPTTAPSSARTGVRQSVKWRDARNSNFFTEQVAKLGHVPAPDFYLDALPPEMGGQLDVPMEMFTQNAMSNLVRTADIDAASRLMTTSYAIAMQSHRRTGQSPIANRCFSLMGEAGTGKGVTGRNFAAGIRWQDKEGNERRGLPYYEITINKDMTMSELIGGIALETDPTSGATVTQLRLSPAGKALLGGGVVHFAEAVENPELMAAINQIANDGEITLSGPGGITQTLSVHPASALMISYNPGTGDGALRPSTESRFQPIPFNPPTVNELSDRLIGVELEKAGGDKEAYNVPTKTEARDLARFYQRVTELAKNQELAQDRQTDFGPRIMTSIWNATLANEGDWLKAIRQVCTPLYTDSMMPDGQAEGKDQIAKIERIAHEIFGMDSGKRAWKRKPLF